MRSFALLGVLLLPAFCACGGVTTAPGVGTEGASCSPGDTCNAGLSCFSRICVRYDGGARSDSGGGSGDATAGVGGRGGSAGAMGADAAAGATASGTAGSSAGGAGTTSPPVDASTDAIDAPGADASACGGADLMTSSANCGACGYACVNARQCVKGRCTPAWRAISEVGAPSPRRRHAASLLGKRIVVSGGAPLDDKGALADTFFYDPSHDAWSPGFTMNAARCSHTSVASATIVYVFGGLTDCSNGGTTGPGLEALFPTSAWQTLTPPKPPGLRYNAQAIWAPSQQMFVFGGASATLLSTGGLFDPSTTSWSDDTCPLPNCATTIGALLSGDGDTVVVWGGSPQAPGAAFNYVTQSWSAWTPPAGSPAVASQYAEDAERWFVLGGADACPATVVVSIYDKASGTWTNDPAPAPAGLTVNENSSNHLVWTGSELFTWSAACDAAGVGGLYQPPAP